MNFNDNELRDISTCRTAFISRNNVSYIHVYIYEFVIRQTHKLIRLKKKNPFSKNSNLGERKREQISVYVTYECGVQYKHVNGQIIEVQIPKLGILFQNELDFKKHSNKN